MITTTLILLGILLLGIFLLFKFSRFVLDLILNLTSFLFRIWIWIFVLIVIALLVLRFSTDKGMNFGIPKIKNLDKVSNMNINNYTSCEKGTEYFFNFHEEIQTKMVKIRVKDNPKKVTLKLRYYPSGKKQEIILINGVIKKIKGGSSYHDTGFYLITDHNCKFYTSF